VWVNDAPLALAETNAIPPAAAVFLRHGTAALGIRIPWSRGQDATPCALHLITGTNAMNVMRLTLTHSRLPDGHPPAHPAGIAYRLRAGSGLDTDEQFSAFRKAFMAEPATAEATADGITLTSGPLAIRAAAPYERAPVTTPAPPRAMLAHDGREVGRPILAELPVISERLAHRKAVTPIPVAAGAPTVWAAVNAHLRCVFEIATDDAGVTYLWEPEYDGLHASGTGRAIYTLDIAQAGTYTLAGRVLSPTPNDDSFHIGITAADGTDILPDQEWHLGTRTQWTWVDLKPKANLPPGRVHITLRTRESGTKIDSLRLTPEEKF
jgi:hypothetical protein